MKRYIFFFCFFIINVISYLSAEKRGRPLWHDEFNGRTQILNKRFWNIEKGYKLWGNNELQHYNDSNISFRDGCLVISATKTDKEYTSVRINTEGKKLFLYGRIEARIKLPYGNGMWPAFWMMGEDFRKVGHPSCGEIDIMEMVGGYDNKTNKLSDSVIYGSIHKPRNEYDNIISKTAKYDLKTSLSEDFHIFGIVWSKDKIDFYIDNTVYYTVDITGDENKIFHKKYFILLNLAIGGNWPGPPTNNTVWPQEMLIDWIRVYKE